MTPRRRRVARGTMAAAAAVLLAVTLAAGTRSAPRPGAAAARAAGVGPAPAASGRQAPVLTAVQRGTIRLGSAGSITLGAPRSGQPALPADPNVDPNAYRSCRDIRTLSVSTKGSQPRDQYIDPDPPAEQQQAGNQPNPDLMSWGVGPVGIINNEANTSYAGGYTNASKLAGSAFVPPGLAAADYRDTYPNPPLEPLPYVAPPGDPSTNDFWHGGSADPGTGSPGGVFQAPKTPAADNLVYQCQVLIGQLVNDPTAPFPPTPAQAAFPPVRATFLAFGFTPVTATVHIQEQVSGGKLVPVIETGYQRYKHYNELTGKLSSGSPPGRGCSGIPADVCSFNFCQRAGAVNTCSDYVITVTAAVTLRLSDVTVNGTPLDVGSHCQTTGPLYTPGNPTADPGNDRVVLQGGTNPSEPSPQWESLGSPDGGGVFHGGAVAGYVTIPPFIRCVTPSGDNLGPLLDATVSGPGNYTKMTAGAACTDIGGICTPPGTLPFLGGRAVPPEKISR